MANPDFNKVIPDFNRISKTQLDKPAVPGDQSALVGAAISLIALIFVFLPWWSVSFWGMSEGHSGISEWMGIIYLICTLPMIVGYIYGHYSIAFWAACGCILFAFLGLIIFPGASHAEISAAKQMGVSVGHTGAILSLLASIGSAVWAFLCANDMSPLKK